MNTRIGQMLRTVFPPMAVLHFLNVIPLMAVLHLLMVLPQLVVLRELRKFLRLAQLYFLSVLHMN